MDDLVETNEIRVKKKKKKDKKLELPDESHELVDFTSPRPKKKRKSTVGGDQEEIFSSPPPINNVEEVSDVVTSSKKKKKSMAVERLEEGNEVEVNNFTNDTRSAKRKQKSPKKKPSSDASEEEVLQMEGEEDVEAVDDADHIQGNDFFEGWNKEDLKELFRRMETAIPKNDLKKYTSTVNKLDWEQIKFKSYSADDCREKWSQIQTKVRHYRILRELLQDANSWLEKPWTGFYKSVKKNRHPDRPKRPLTSYMLFYMDKKKKYRKKYPNLEANKLVKIIAEKFHSLPEHKKEKYTTQAANNMAEYYKQLQKFMQEHPAEAKMMKKSRKHVEDSQILGPPKPITPFRMFLNDKIKQIDGVKTQTDIAEITAQCKEKWNSMSARKKGPWIRWAHEAEKKYLEEIKIYSEENPDYVPPTYKSVLTQKEKNILARLLGRPEKPPRSAYALFSRLMLKDPEMQEKFKTPKERLLEIARLWKEAPKILKDDYADKVKHLLENYKMEFATYLESLPEEKRSEELAAVLPKKKAPAKAKEPKMKQQTLNEVLKSLIPAADSSKPTTLEELRKKEPVHPPEEPFEIFKDEYLTKGLTEKKAAKAWKSLSDLERKKYEDKLGQLKQQYIEDFRKFLTSLKPEELNTYSSYKQNLMKENASRNNEEEDDEEEEDQEEETEVDSEPDSESSLDGPSDNDD